jgi:hypothetical protein
MWAVPPAAFEGSGSRCMTECLRFCACFSGETAHRQEKKVNYGVMVSRTHKGKDSQFALDHAIWTATNLSFAACIFFPYAMRKTQIGDHAQVSEIETLALDRTRFTTRNNMRRIDAGEVQERDAFNRQSREKEKRTTRVDVFCSCSICVSAVNEEPVPQ